MIHSYRLDALECDEGCDGDDHCEYCEIESDYADQFYLSFMDDFSDYIDGEMDKGRRVQIRIEVIDGTSLLASFLETHQQDTVTETVNEDRANTTPLQAILGPRYNESLLVIASVVEVRKEIP